MILLGVLLFSTLLVVPPRRIRLSVKQVEGSVDMAVVLDVAAAALMSGASLPVVLRHLSGALDGLTVGVSSSPSAKLSEVANMLVMGASWDEAWGGVDGYDLLARALKPAWVDGVAPVPLLQRAAQTHRLTQVRRAKEAAARLGAALVMPLGLCFLPAFVILGVVPVVAGAASSIW